MRFFRFCRSNTSDIRNAQEPAQPTMVQETDTEVQPCDRKRSASAAGICNVEGSQDTPKIPRFELDACSTSNAWDLPDCLAAYLKKYMHLHIPEKEIREKILHENPIPSNVRQPQVLDNYIRELLVEHKRTLTSTHEKSLKAVQEKILHILGPLSRLWVIMENEKISSASSDEEFQELTMVSNLFEQTMLLVGQTFQSITYYRRHNILSTLIDNPSKVKEILKNADATLDGADNIYLFGDKFEEKLLKDTNAKQKSKLLFSGLQRSKSSNNTSGTSYSGNPSYTSYNQPFRGSPLPRTNGGRGHFFSRAAQRGKKKSYCDWKDSDNAGFATCARLGTKFVSTGAEVRPTSCRQVETFSKKLESIDQRPSHFGNSRGLPNSFFVHPTTSETSSGNSIFRERQVSDRPGNSRYARKRSHPNSEGTSWSVFEPFIFSREKRRRIQAGCKLEKIESKHTLCPFQNGGSFSFKGTAFERGLFMQVGLEGRILHRGSSQIIQEVCKGSLEGESLRVSLPVLRSGACPKDFHKAYENSNCINETSECSVDNIFRRHVINGKLIGGNYDGKGHIDFYIATSRVCDKLSEVDSDTMPSNSILRGGNRLNHYDHISSFAEEGTNYSAMQRYIEPIRRFLKAVNSIDRPALVNSNSYSSSASSVPSFATPTNFRTSGETEFSCTHSPVRRSEGRNSVVDRKFDVVQGESNNISTSSTSYNFGRLHARVGGSLSRTNNRGSVDTRGTEKSYKHIRAEGSSVGNFDVHLYASTSTFNTFANRQYGGSFLYSENGGDPQQSFVRHQQGDLGLFIIQRDHNYCRTPSWSSQSGGRSTVSIKGGFKRMEAKTECFSSIVQKKVDPRHRSLCVAGVKPGPMLLFLETRPLQQGQRCIPNVMEIPKRVCFSTFQPNREGTEQGTSGPSSNFADNSSLAQSVVVSTSSTNVNRETNSNTSRKGSLNGPKVGEAFTHRDREIKTSALDNFRGKLFAEGISKNATYLITGAKRQGSISHYESAW